MKRKGTNQKDLALSIGMDPTRFTKSKQGERPWTLAEVTAMARRLDVPIETLLKKFGYELPEHGAPIIGRVLPDSRVSPVIGAHAGKRIALPPSIPPNTVAYVHEPDGAVYVALKGEPRVVPPGAFGRLCIVEADDGELPWLGTLDKARHRDSVSLKPVYGDAGPKTFRQLHSALVVVATLYL
jgi:hypothetical protein